ncbi:hypothetical protein HHK36_016361 [Tetracentron sinense]|uniref:Fe2OG dioxygenase domain-containing protein n=1 Tax=Tetracentron sinense TaxID=13715 RepID=A0A835DEM1_TETSI|nr:hypothetical protein HHK36_016361 [Tetracentron sinense]
MQRLLTRATVSKSSRPKIIIKHRTFHSCPDSYAKFIDIYARDRVLHRGKMLHAHLIINGLGRLTYLSCKLITFYAQCGRISEARHLFDSIPKTNLRRWIVLIGACSRGGFYQEALDLFSEMLREGLSPNQFVVPSILRACANLSDGRNGEKIHGVILRSLLGSDAFVDSALTDMYSKCGRVEKARQLFDKMVDRDLVVWNSMVSGYAQQGFPKESLHLVEKMRLMGVEPNLVTWNALISGFSQVGDDVMVSDVFRMMWVNGVEPDVVSWTSVISAFVQNFRNDEAFDTFKQMMGGGVLPSSVTISSLLPACATVADLRRGKEIHGYSLVIGVQGDVFVSSSLVDMYAKCGFIFEAVKMFNKMCQRNTVTWNSMIFGYANHGYCNEAIELFNRMIEEEVEPNHLTFTAALMACSHAGLVKHGQNLFHSMQEEYGIKPRLEHYACMVDLLGRAGDLIEAYKLIKTMPIEPDSFVWGALLGACRNHGNIELAEIAAKHLFELEPESAGSCLLLSNVYADAGSWGDASEMNCTLLSKWPQKSGSKPDGLGKEAVYKEYDKLKRVRMDLKVEDGGLQEDQGLGWGRSIPVQSVQEMVRRDWQSVPDKYIRDQVDRPKDSELCPISSEIPIIDFSLLASGHKDERRKLHLACKDWGFFQIINHRVTEQVLHKMKVSVAGFFELPLEEKKKYSMAADDIQGYGQGYVVSDQQKLDWGDLTFLLTLPPKFKNMKYWPTIVPGFKEAVEQYSIEINTVVKELLSNLSLLMDMDKDNLLVLHGEMKQGMRLNYYPTCCRPDLVLGVSPHSDASSITVLLQDDEITGLQIQHEGGWVPVKPVPNALVVNIGDVIEAWSNGMYKSIEHRAVTNEKKARMSVATFVIPNDDIEIGPLDPMNKPTSNIDPAYETWHERDSLVLLWINASLHASVLQRVIGLQTSREVWQRLERLHLMQSHSRVLQLKQQFQSLKKGGMSITDFLDKMKSLADCLEAVGQQVSDYEICIQVLNGLGPEYDPVHTSVLNRDSPILFDELFGQLLTFELRLESHASNNTFEQPSTALFTNRASQSSTQGHGGSRGRSYHYRGQGRGRHHGGRGQPYGEDPLPRTDVRMDLKVKDGGFQEDQGLGWGRSIPVQSVQEMVRRNSQFVPDKYIQEHVDRPKDSDLCPISSEIPIIDFSLLASGHEDERRKLHLACKDWGFFQIINHGVTEQALHKMKVSVAGFFELPLEEKKKYSMAADDIQGYGQVYVVSDQQKLDWGDLTILLTFPPKFKNMKYWPTTVPGFKEAVEQYSIEINTVTKELLSNLSLLMNMDKDGLLVLHGEMKQGMRLNYYPTCCRPDLVLGVSPHSDASTITVLLQDDEITGLQIQHEGSWVPVKPVPNALVVNIGDVIEAWSNGMYKSIEHRAITNEKIARMSVATFVIPNDDIEIGPLDPMVDDHQPRMYKKIKYVDYLRHTLGRKMEGKSHTQFLKLENK